MLPSCDAACQYKRGYESPETYSTDTISSVVTGFQIRLRQLVQLQGFKSPLENCCHLHTRIVLKW